MTQHTPGPWILDQDRTDDGTYYVRANNEVAVAEALNSRAFSIGEPEANARLIAAAPELLEALRIIERQMDGETMFPGAVYLSLTEANQIVEAIAKATGG